MKADVRKRCNTATEWKVAQRRSISSSIQHLDRQSLLHRDFTSADYDLLLALANDSTPMLHEHLLQALERVNFEDRRDKTCCICLSPFTPSDSIHHLPCRFNKDHIAHDSCISNLLIEAQSSSIYGNAGAQCPSCNDKSWIFPMLADDPTNGIWNKKKRKTKKNPSEKTHGIGSDWKIKESVSSCSDDLSALCIMGTSSCINTVSEESKSQFDSSKLRRSRQHTKSMTTSNRRR